jgi:hypothetical protein
MGVYVVRALVQLRNLLAGNRELIGFVYPTEKMDATKGRGENGGTSLTISPHL